MGRNLEQEAEAFARDLNDLVRNTFKGRQPLFKALAANGGSRVSISTLTVRDGKEIDAPLTVALKGRRNISKVQFYIAFECQWSSESYFLGVQNSSMVMKLENNPNPLFRYDFDKNKRGGNPTAYLHVHAHRDEIAWLMIQGKSSRPRMRKQKGNMPVLSAIHFPLGGERFRPCIEDFFEFSILEFGLDVKPTAIQTLTTGRQIWRQKQLKAAIGDSPLIAVEALRDYGWSVEETENSKRISRDKPVTKL